MDKADQKCVKIHLPEDFVTGDSFNEKAKVGEATLESGIPDEWLGLDIGPKSYQKFDEVIAKAKVIIWNG